MIPPSHRWVSVTMGQSFPAFFDVMHHPRVPIKNKFRVTGVVVKQICQQKINNGNRCPAVSGKVYFESQNRWTVLEIDITKESGERYFPTAGCVSMVIKQKTGIEPVHLI